MSDGNCQADREGQSPRGASAPLRRLRPAAGADADALAALRAHFSEDQIVELTLVICAANFTNRFNDGLRVEPDLG